MLPFSVHVCKTSLSKILSIPITLLYILGGAAAMGGRGAINQAMFCVLPLCAIWFADTWGQQTGNSVRFHAISAKTPVVLMHFGGWLIFLSKPLFVIVRA